MDTLDRRELGSAEVDHSASRPDEADHGARVECDTFADRRAAPDSKTDGDTLAYADAATDRVTRSDREAGAAGHRPARVRLCGHTRVADRGDRRGGGEERKTKETCTKEEVKSQNMHSITGIFLVVYSKQSTEPMRFVVFYTKITGAF